MAMLCPGKEIKKPICPALVQTALMTQNMFQSTLSITSQNTVLLFIKKPKITTNIQKNPTQTQTTRGGHILNKILNKDITEIGKSESDFSFSEQQAYLSCNT